MFRGEFSSRFCYSMVQTWLARSELRDNSPVCSSRSECAARNHSARPAQGCAVSTSARSVDFFLLQVHPKDWMCIFTRRYSPAFIPLLAICVLVIISISITGEFGPPTRPLLQRSPGTIHRL